MRVGVLYICTGKYTAFFEEAYETAKHNLFPGCSLHFYVWTDREEDIPVADDVTVFHKEHKPWPDATLSRFETFCSQREVLEKEDVLVFINANLRFEQPVEGTQTLPVSGTPQQMFCVRHLQFISAFRDVYSLVSLRINTEHNPQSTAYIAHDEIPYLYCAGGFYGGYATSFLDMCAELADAVKKDAEQGIVAIWHDESYFNRFRLNNPTSFRVLTPSYCLPELEKNCPYQRIVTVRDKNLFATRHGFSWKEDAKDGWTQHFDVTL